MALGPPRGQGSARAVAQGPTLQWGVGGTIGGTAAAALRLPLAPGVAGTVAGGPLPPPPRPTRDNRCPEGQRMTRAACPRSEGGRGRGPPYPPPQPPAPSGRAWSPFDLQPAYFAHGAWTKRPRTVTRPGMGAWARGPGPPSPPSQDTNGGTTASPWFAGGTARPP